MPFAIGIEDMKKILLPDFNTATFTPTIAGILTNYWRLITEEIYLKLAINHDRNITQQPLNLVIRRLPTARYQYVNPIAHQLAVTLRLTPLEICQNLQSQIQLFNRSNFFILEIHCWYTDAGYIHFQLMPTAIAIWLNWIQDGSPEWLNLLELSVQKHLCSIKVDNVRASSNFAQSSKFSPIVYAHARCCSLLRLARAEKLISFDNFSQITTPNWLNCDIDRTQDRSKTDEKLIFDTYVEEQLIHALMDVLDGIYGERPQNWSKLALNLARSWLELDRACHVFGEIKRQNPRLAIARCGLTAIVRRYLQVLLEDYLEVTALTEL